MVHSNQEVYWDRNHHHRKVAGNQRIRQFKKTTPVTMKADTNI